MAMKNKPNKPSAFVLMPFDKEFDAAYSCLIKPSIEAAGYNVSRADDIVSQQNILKDIVRSIGKAYLIIADLTGLNANVFYELGIAHTLLKPVIIIAQSIDEVPFDLASYKVIQYSTHFMDAPKLREELKDRGEKAKVGELEFGNPISDFLDLDLLRYKICVEIPKVRGEVERPLIKEEYTEEKGIWDFMVLTEKSTSRLTDCAKKITEAMEEIGKKMQMRTKEAQEIQKSSALGTASRMYNLAKDAANDMNLYADRMENEQPELHVAWNAFEENISGLIRVVNIRADKDKEAIINYRSVIKGLKEANKQSLEGIREYRKVVEGMKGISSDVNRASKRITYVLDLLISDFVSGDSYCTKILSLLEEKINKATNN